MWRVSSFFFFVWPKIDKMVNLTDLTLGLLQDNICIGIKISSF